MGPGAEDDPVPQYKKYWYSGVPSRVLGRLRVQNQSMEDAQFSKEELAKKKALCGLLVFVVAMICLTILRVGKMA